MHNSLSKSELDRYEEDKISHSLILQDIAK